MSIAGLYNKSVGFWVDLWMDSSAAIWVECTIGIHIFLFGSLNILSLCIYFGTPCCWFVSALYCLLILHKVGAYNE